MTKERSGAVTKVRATLNGEPKTHAELKAMNPELTDGQISMSLSYLKKRGLIEHETVERSAKFGRKMVYSYKLKGQDARQAD